MIGTAGKMFFRISTSQGKLKDVHYIILVHCLLFLHSLSCTASIVTNKAHFFLTIYFAEELVHVYENYLIKMLSLRKCFSILIQ
jgi:hypothetical protein